MFDFTEVQMFAGLGGHVRSAHASGGRERDERGEIAQTVIIVAHPGRSRDRDRHDHHHQVQRQGQHHPDRVTSSDRLIGGTMVGASARIRDERGAVSLGAGGPGRARAAVRADADRAVRADVPCPQRRRAGRPGGCRRGAPVRRHRGRRRKTGAGVPAALGARHPQDRGVTVNRTAETATVTVTGHGDLGRAGFTWTSRSRRPGRSSGTSLRRTTQ